jgi:hypothetical protein
MIKFKLLMVFLTIATLVQAQEFTRTVHIITPDQRKLTYTLKITNLRLNQTENNCQIVWTSENMEYHLPTMPKKCKEYPSMKVYEFAKNDIKHRLVVSYYNEKINSVLFSEYQMKLNEWEIVKQITFE